MNEITEWINGKRDFSEGVLLYKKYGTNRALKNRFDQFGEDVYNTNILRIELPKVRYKAEKPDPITPEKKQEVEKKAKVKTLEEITAELTQFLENAKTKHPDLKAVIEEHKKVEDIQKLKNIRSSFHLQLMRVANLLTNQDLDIQEAAELITEGEYYSYKIKEQTAKMNNKTIAPLKQKKVDPDDIDVNAITDFEEANKHLNNAMRRRTDIRNKVKKKLGSKRKIHWKTIENQVRKEQKDLLKQEFELLERREKLINELRIKSKELSEI